MVRTGGAAVTGDFAKNDTRLAKNPPPGQDLRFSYRSKIDGARQPYAVYVPKSYDGSIAWPLIINLHGTSSGFGEEHVGETSVGYGPDRNALYLWAAENHGAIMATPHGRGITEFRGTGEHDVLSVLEEVKQRYNVDEDRISLTGLSMGGTGSFEIGLHHPGLFSAVAPMASANSFPWLAANGQHVPFWCIGGEFDRDFVHNGGLVCAEKMIELGHPTHLSVMKTREHSDFEPEMFDEVVEWLLQHKVVRQPKEYSFSADLPMYGQAYWTAIDGMTRPGPIATIHARLVSPSRVSLTTENASAIAVLPALDLFDLEGPIVVKVDGAAAFSGLVAPNQELKFTLEDGSWTASVEPRRQTSLTDWRVNPVAEAPEELTMAGIESPLANWVSDAMRAATGADLAMYNRRYHRGRPIRKGTVDEVDLLQCFSPGAHYLAIAELTGRDVLDIVEDNIEVPYHVGHSYPMTVELGENEFLVQPSGFSYAFERGRPDGQRVVEHDLDERRTYKVALEGQVPRLAQVWRRATLRIADKYPMEHEVTDVPNRGALYAHALRTGRIEAAVEGRIREL